MIGWRRKNLWPSLAQRLCLITDRYVAYDKLCLPISLFIIQNLQILQILLILFLYRLHGTIKLQ